ncbi:uncharacterized protein LOC121417559 [Lytechinus variegatus]|uniref:uncharacterized protein LOC121417559 n=1 Tax=Lytechinus variegatus TaxID=7654 RepID=UPI001BB13DF5|nr:uncharacterized protein LOC121417559 [Lytechinus variegatus]
MSAIEESNLVEEIREDRSTRSGISVHSMKSRTSQVAKSHASSLQSVKSERLSIKKHEASLKVKQSFEGDHLKLLQQETEVEQLFRKRRIALQQQLDKEEATFKRQQKEIAMRKDRLARRERLAQLSAIKQVLEEFEDEELGESDSEISFRGMRKEEKSEGMQRFFDSQEKIHPHQSEKTGVHQKTEAISDLSNPWVPPGLDSLVSSLEASVAQITRIAIGQSEVSNQLAATSQLPKIDVPMFSGEPMNYPLWKNAFDCMVDAKPISDSNKLNYLNTYVCGKAKEIVEHYLLLGEDDGYQKARAEIDSRFGNPSALSVAYTRKLCSWPSIESKDASGLRDFSDFLQKVLSAKTKVKNLGILDFPQENAKLVAKLPEYLEDEWREEIESWRETNSPQSYPSFSCFVGFVKKAADRANIPELEPLRLNLSKRAQNENARIFSISGMEDVNSTCPFCDGSHHLESCASFMMKPIAERKLFFFKRMLCFGCALTCEHRGRECMHKRMCRICRGRHLTCLHEDRSKKTEDQGIPDQGANNTK